MPRKKKKDKESACARPAGLTPDYWRQLDVFDPQNFKRPVHIIGVGATGSWIALLLGKMGVKTMKLWDFDCVENHNLPNQIFGLEELGMPKVDAARKILQRDCGIDVATSMEKVDGTQPMSGIVYVCTDEMVSRRAIWEKALRLNLNVDLVIETRLAAELCIVYVVRPTNLNDIKGYESTLYSDAEAEESACTYRSISSMVSVVAGLASHKVVKLEKGILMRPVTKLVKGGEHSSDQMFCINPIITTSNKWG